MPDAACELSVADAVRAGAAQLTRAGCETPRLDAEILLAWTMGVERERLVLDGSDGVPSDALDRYRHALGRRAEREPVAYITGVRHFRRIALAVDRRVLIPRPETELLVEAGLTLGRGSSVADVGTGSGAVALALKDERPDLNVLAADVDLSALSLARANAVRLGLDVEFVQADLLAGLDRELDAVLANLPYVALEAAGSLPPEITDFEPGHALFAGDDGLELVRRLISMADALAVVALEVGFDQSEVVSQLLADAGFGSVERLRDLAGHERVIVGRR